MILGRDKVKQRENAIDAKVELAAQGENKNKV